MGQSSSPVSVSVTMISSGVVANPEGLTLGISGADYAVSPGTCSEGMSFSVGQQCDVMVTFQPRYPGTRSGAVVLLNGNGTLLGTTLLSGMATGSLSVLKPGAIATVAGVTDWLYQGDGVPATAAPIFLPMGLAVDAKGDLYLADSSNDRVRRVDASTGLISTVAGNGTAGYSGDGGPATAAMISNPGGLALDGAGNLFLADSNNDAIRRVDAVSGIITTIAGIPQSGGYSGNGVLATSAKLTKPEGITLDSSGDLYIADTGNHAIREVDATSGVISVVAGTGVQGYNGDHLLATDAELNGPWSVSIGADGSLYIADTLNQRVRMVAAATKIITTLAGTGTQGYSGDGGVASAAMLNAPAALLLDPAGNVYIADSGNNRIREINVATNDIQTLSGGNTEGFSGDGGPANKAIMYGPYSLFFDQSGNLFFSDMFNNRVREIKATIAILPAFPVMRVGKVSAPQLQGLVNDGNAALTVGATELLNAELDPGTTTCNAGSILTFNSSASTCIFGVDFAPTTVGGDVLGSVLVPSNAGNSPGTIHLSGQVLTVQPTTVALSSSKNPSAIGAAVTFTATISAGGDITTGTISFLANGTVIAGCSSVTEGSNQMAACATSTLLLGSTTITASYSGDTNDASSVSPGLVQVVKQPATIALTASPNPEVVTSTVILTATATAPTGTPTGTITFYDGATVIGSTNLNNGVASFSTAALAVGHQALSAQYSGDTNNAPATSLTVTEVVQQASSITTIASSNSTETVGAAMTLTGTVTSTNGPAPAGSIEFMNGATMLGSGTVGSNGIANLVLSSLAPGTYALTATYTGDTDDASSTSTALSETIEQIPTATTLIPNTNPILAGAMLNLVVTVIATGASTNGGTLSGNVTFSEGSTVDGTSAINSSGNAILALTTLSAGSHFIVASYIGSANYAPSTSTVLVEIVQQTATTTTVGSPATSTLAGETASFTAVVTSVTLTPTGSVTFASSGLNIGQAQLNAQGVAAFATSTIGVGTQTITASYIGNGNYTSSISAPLQHTVTQATPSLVLAGPTAAVNAGATFSVTATLTSSGFRPSGTLTLHNGAVTVATQSVSGNGIFTFANLSLGVGTYPLTAVYSGDADNAPASSNPFNLIVQLTPTVTSLVGNRNPSTLGQTVIFTATTTGIAPTLTGATQFMDGAAVLGSSVVSANGVASFTTAALPFGPHSITATYAGDADHSSSVSSALNEKIIEAASVSLSSSSNPAIFGTNIVFTIKIATVVAQLPTGTVILQSAAAPLGTVNLDSTGTGTLQTASLPVGSTAISANYSGDASYSAASASLTQAVQGATTQITLNAGPNPAIYATPVTFTAAVTGNGGGIQAGSVTFTDAGAPIGTVALSPTGAAVLTLSTLTPGTHSIVANYGGNANIGPSTSMPQVIVVKELTTTILTSNADPVSTLSSIILTATVTNSGAAEPTGTITFTNGSTVLGTATLGAYGAASLSIPSLPIGKYPLAASYAGDADNIPSASSSLTEAVQLRATTTALTSTANDPNNPSQVTLFAVVEWSGPVSPTGTITFSQGATIFGTSQLNSIGVATLGLSLSAASETIVATYSGDASYAASSSLATTISGGSATQFSMQLLPSAITLQTKQHASTTLSFLSLSGFADTLQLGCLGLPTSATCTFSSPKVTLTSDGTATMQLVIDTGDPLGASSTAALESMTTRGIVLCLLPCLFFTGFGMRRRLIKTGNLLIFLAIISLTLFASGCSGLNINGTPPGTYTFKVTAAGQQTGTTVSAIVTLTVTQ